MTFHKRPISVLHLPQQLSGKEVEEFLREMQNCLGSDRPQLVVDCSAATRLDRAHIRHLLCCLEEAMKRNGDVKLAAVPPEVGWGERDSIGVHRLFESFETTQAAVNSFHQLPSHAAMDAPAPCDSVTAESAV
jgi:anti-anti-sigma regulatory factor